MKLFIQDPTKPDSYSLHEALIQSCEFAFYGGGAYAFVTSGGVKLLLEDETFDKFLSAGNFKLIVGIDEITNIKALESLQQLKDKHGNKLDIYAFLHNTKGSLFHPKFSWFKNSGGGIVVLGSGNLTQKGLRRNWEAFNVVNVSKSEIEEIEELWNDWLTSNMIFLKSITDNEVLEKVKENAKTFIRIKKKIIQTPSTSDESQGYPTQTSDENLKEQHLQDETSTDEDLDAWEFTDSDSVLVYEINNNNNRWSQINFHKEIFTDFFGAQIGNTNLRILLRNVLPSGLLSEVEVRPGVAVQSHNWRFELKAATGNYPSNGRPIGVFVRISTRMFLYMLAMPNNSYYSEINQFLNNNNITSNPKQMKKCITTVELLKNNCTHLPIWEI